MQSIESVQDEAKASDPLRLTAFFTWAYATLLGFTVVFVLGASPHAPRAWWFAGAAAASYALIYATPAILAGWATRPLLRRGRAGLWATAVLTVGVLTATQFFLYADYKIHALFGFHINGFVVNLVTTPEGIASMGSDPATGYFYTAVGVGLVALNAMMWWVLVRGETGRRISAALAGRPVKLALVVLALLALGERVTYGFSHVQARADVMAVSAALPGYQPMTFRRLAASLGVKATRRLGVDVADGQRALAYPSRPVEAVAPEKPLNIVWLVCESLRADMLTPEIMPQTWAFAQENLRFTRHHSGGNGTRMGVFTLFYGVPGSYWFKALESRRSPLLMDRLQQLGYRLHLSTSAAFTYPEFDKTVFAHVAAEDLYAHAEKQGWIADRHHVARMKSWLDEPGDRTPFFMFHFFESPHARYYFPPESVIRRPYLEDFNYATADIARDIELIRNRYINAVHHLDSQLGEVIAALRAKNLLENTLVVITGDHGEEFMEAGRWGHNSEFHEPQVRVPLVVHLPGQGPAVLDHPTSHVDLASTVLPLLGVRNPPSDYTTGQNLLDATPRLLTFSDWDRIAVSDGKYKMTFPLKAGVQMTVRVTTADDQPVADEGAVLSQQGATMARLMGIMTRFTQKP